MSRFKAEYPQNALTGALDAIREGRPLRVCYATSPDRLTACGREHGHAVTAMTLPDGRRTYVGHNSRHDGTGKGW